jgi:alpha-beta hydrolase superfamily lysophospholipase
VRGFGPDRDQPARAKLDCVDTVDDVQKLLQSIHSQHPDYKVFLLGESMGGALTVRIAAENSKLLDGIVCSAPAWKLLKMSRTAVKGIVELALFPHSSPGPAGRALLHQATSDPALTEHWLNDHSHKLKLTFGEATSFLNFIAKTDGFAEHLNLPVLVVQGLNDHLVSPRAVARLFADIPSENKTFLVDGTGEHLVLEEGRFTPAVIEKLVSWMKRDSLRAANKPKFEAVDDANLTKDQQKKLSKLMCLAGG